MMVVVAAAEQTSLAVRSRVPEHLADMIQPVRGDPLPYAVNTFSKIKGRIRVARSGHFSGGPLVCQGGVPQGNGDDPSFAVMPSFYFGRIFLRHVRLPNSPPVDTRQRKPGIQPGGLWVAPSQFLKALV